MDALLVPPTCKSISKLDALLAVSVMLSRIPLAIPEVFQVPDKSSNGVVLVPVTL